MEAYNELVHTVLSQGVRKPNRTGVDTLSMFGYHYDVDLAEGFPLLTSKSVSWKNIVVENLWFLSGSTNVELLRRHGCKFWDPWADEEGEVPSSYGAAWRHLGGDQLRWVEQELIENPMSRRLCVTAWDPGTAFKSKLPPCHVFWVLNTQPDPEMSGPGRLNLHLTQRSADIALGVPYNLAGYALLLHLFARFGGLDVGVFSHTLVDAHIYTAKPDGSMSEYDHVPGLLEQIRRPLRRLPEVVIESSIQTLDDVLGLLEAPTDELLERIALQGYDPHPAIPFKVAV